MSQDKSNKTARLKQANWQEVPDFPFGYLKSLQENCQIAADSPMVNGRIALMQDAIPVVTAIQEPLSVVVGEMICCTSLPILAEELEKSMGLPQADLYAALEFLSALLVPRDLAPDIQFQALAQAEPEKEKEHEQT